MKIALLLTGLVRTYKSTFESLIKLIDDNPNNEYHLYVCFWDRTKGKMSDLSKIVNIDEVLKVYDKYLYKYKVMESTKWDYFDCLLDYVVKNITSPKIRTKKFIKNAIISQFYSYKEVMSMVEDENYDLVIKSRFDITIENKSILNFNIDKNTIYFENNTYGFNDIIFWGDYNSMKQVMNIYDIIDKKRMGDIEGDKYYPEFFLKSYIKHLKIKMEKVKKPNYKLLR